jgi:hypothetical protein
VLLRLDAEIDGPNAAAPNQQMANREIRSQLQFMVLKRKGLGSGNDNADYEGKLCGARSGGGVPKRTTEDECKNAGAEFAADITNHPPIK